MISVIISTHNRPEKLQLAVNSVMRQSYPDWELIIVDDHSEEKFTPPDDPRIKYIYLEENFGCDTRPKNVGTLATKGDYIAYLDDDNTYRPEHLAILLKELEAHPEVDIVYGDRTVIDARDGGSKVLGVGVNSDFDTGLLMQRNFIDTSDVLIRRQALFDVGGWDERYKKFVDWNLWVRLAKAGKKFLHVPKVLSDYYLHGEMKSTTNPDRVPRWDALDLEITLPYLGAVKEPRVAVFSITYDRLEYTKACFESLKATADYPYDHYVIDNGSSDGTPEYLTRGDFHSVTLNGVNKGISKASNLVVDLIKNGDYDIIVKVDNDCYFENKGWLKAMVEVWKRFRMLALSCYVQGLRDNPGGPNRYDYKTVGGELVGFTNHLGGICHFVDAAAYQTFRWDEMQPKHGVQDLEFSQYLTHSDYLMGYLENWFCTHYEGTGGQHQRYPEYFERRKKEKVERYEEQ